MICQRDPLLAGSWLCSPTCRLFDNGRMAICCGRRYKMIYQDLMYRYDVHIEYIQSIHRYRVILLDTFHGFTIGFWMWEASECCIEAKHVILVGTSVEVRQRGCASWEALGPLPGEKVANWERSIAAEEMKCCCDKRVESFAMYIVPVILIMTWILGHLGFCKFWLCWGKDSWKQGRYILISAQDKDWLQWDEYLALW